MSKAVRNTYIKFDGEKFERVQVSIPPTLSCMQDFVGGYIEPLFTTGTNKAGVAVTGYVNEEGLLEGLPINALKVQYGLGKAAVMRWAGNLLIVGLKMRTGDTVLLTEAEADEILAQSDDYILNLPTL